MRRLLAAVAAALTIAATLSFGSPTVAEATSSRGAVLCQSDTFRCLAASGFRGQSVWGSWGPGHNCVSYVAYRLRRNGASKPWSGPIGDAKYWDDSARTAGFRVDHEPAVGAIAEWDTGAYGHVAYVEKVTRDFIVISEDAYVTDTDGFAQTRRLSRHGSLVATANFLHILDVASA